MGEHLAAHPALASLPADLPGVAALKGLLDNGISIDDPRCRTLIGLLTNSIPPTAATPISLQHPAPSTLALHRFSNATGGDAPGPHANASSPSAAKAPRPDRRSLPLPRLPDPPSKPARNADRFPPSRSFGTPNLFPFSSPQQPPRAYYTPLQWPVQGEPETGVPYLPPSSAHHMRFPLQPANIHASYAPHLVAQPVLSHAPNHAFSFEDNQHAILARRLMIEQDAEAEFGRPSPSTAPPASFDSPYARTHVAPSGAAHFGEQVPGTEPSLLDPSKYFSETYSSPTSQHASYPGAPPQLLSAASGRSRAQVSTGPRREPNNVTSSESERQIQALDLLSLHKRTSDQANVNGSHSVPRDSANTSGMHSKKSLLGGSALRNSGGEHARLGSHPLAPLAALTAHNTRPRSGLEHLLTRENITPKALKPAPVEKTKPSLPVSDPTACDTPVLNSTERRGEHNPNQSEATGAMEPNNCTNRSNTERTGIAANGLSAPQVMQTDTVFRAAILANAHEQLQNQERLSYAEKDAPPKKLSKSRRPKDPNAPRKPRKPKDPSTPKEKRPRKSRKKQKNDQDTLSTTPKRDPPHPSLGKDSGSGINASRSFPLTNSNVAVPMGSSRILSEPLNPDAPANKSDKKAKQPKRKRSSKKTAKVMVSTTLENRDALVTEEVLENGKILSMDGTRAASRTLPADGSHQSHILPALRTMPHLSSGALPNSLAVSQEESAVKAIKTKKKRKKKKKAEEVDLTPNGAPGHPNLQKRVAGVAVNHVFQLKAQVDALRRVSRGMEPPTEVTIASGGIQPMSEITANGLMLPNDILRKGAYQEDSKGSARKLLKPLLAPQAHKSEPVPSASAQMLRPQRSNDRLYDYRKHTLETVAKMRTETNGLSPGTVMPSLHFLHRLPNGIVSAGAQKEGATLDSSVPTSLSSNDASAAVPSNAHSKGIPVSLKQNIPSTSNAASAFLRTSAAVRDVTTHAVQNALPPVSDSVPNGLPLAQKKGTKAKRAPRKSKKSLGIGIAGVTKKESARSTRRKAASAPLTIGGPNYNGRTFRELLLEREQRVKSRIRQRLHELKELPDDIPEEIRVQAIIEKKKLNLLALQRSARTEVTEVMHGLFARGSSVLVDESNHTRFRRPTPSNWSWRHVGSAAGSTSGTLTEEARRNVQILEQKHRAEQETRRRQRQIAVMEKLVVHHDQVRDSQVLRLAQHKKLMKDLDRYFKDKVREEERRKRKEMQERLRALRENNEEEYIKLLKNTKNKRLLQLLKQTDEYLRQIGAKVEQQKQAAREEEMKRKFPTGPENNDASGADGGNTGNQGSAKLDDDDLKAMHQRRNEYYTVTHAVKEKVFQPKSLVGGTLKPYQVEGLEWLVSLYNNNLNGILADEMGLGKTIQTLSLITYLVEVKQVIGPYLIIVPLSTMSNWVRELERWAPSLTKVVYRGDPATRRNIQTREMAGKDYNVLLSTYEFIVRDKAVLGKVKWKYIIIDEGHRMKNSDCKLALTLGSKYSSRNRVLLTGTPLQNNLTELWALLNFLLPTIFSNSETFETWFNAPFQAASLGGNQELDEEENLLVISRLHQVLRPFMLRRLKTDVECQLPDKVEEVIKCQMSAWQQVLYRQMRDRLGIAAGGASGSTKAFNNIVMQLKKVCNHPYLFYNDEDLAGLPRDNLIRTSGKFELLCHSLLKLKRTGHRVLMFSQMTAALDYLELFLYNIGVTFLRLDGTTKAEDRQTMLEEFNAKDSPHFCFLLSTRAGGLGLNLQTADTVIIFDSDWNPMMDLQAQDRAHRIGQTKEVRVLRLICAGTVEVSILERANKKLRMDAQVIQAGQFNNKSSDSDRQEMLKEVLRSKSDEEELRSVSSLESINRMLARSDEELELFEEMDRERLEEAEKIGRPPLMVDEGEIPKWVFMPEVEQKSKEQLEAEYIEHHGRGQRKRKKVSYADALTEEEWTEAIEEDGDIEGAMSRKRRKLSQIREGSAEKSGSSKESSPPVESGSRVSNSSAVEAAEVVEAVEAAETAETAEAVEAVEEVEAIEAVEAESSAEGRGKPPLQKKRGRGRPRKHPR